ncbi:uncharacterized protein LOC117228359 [Megalopta genalis]|uniref:uncharacterized protein LOC117228359 n=1 Tax=Megalopta genalis TaxID=115081 RepID=UPI003FD670C9
MRETRVRRHPESFLVRLRLVLLVVVLHLAGQSLAYDNSTSVFVERCRADCAMQRDFLSCGKFRVVRWLNSVVREKEFSYGPLRVVRIPSLPSQLILPKVPQSRVFKSGAIDALNFARDIVEDLLTKRAVVYTIDNAMAGRSFGTMPMIMDEGEITLLQARKESDDDWRLFKKKKSVILPLLILLNLIKLKLLLLPVFLGVHFIKKLLVLGSLLLPSILSHLKICKVPQPQPHMYPHQTWATAAEAPVDYPTGYGQEEAWAHRNDYQGHLGYPGYPAYRHPYG